MTDAKQFLDAILPPVGERCLVVINGRTRQFFFQTNEELVVALRYHDQHSNGAVYHACATYVPGRKRTAAAVASIGSLWLDIDCGEGKPYPIARDGADALVLFCRAAVLPMPLLVRSGRGLHAYWLLDRPVDVATWKPLAGALKAACRAHSFSVDPARITDPASILRPPETTNRKDGQAVKVVAGPIPDRVSPDIFKSLADTPQPTFTYANGTTNNSLAHQLARGAVEAVNLEDLVASCGQMRKLRESEGRLPEPQWYGTLGVLTFIQNGHEVAHEWSKGHPNYTPTETDKKLTQLEKLTGPTTCTALHEVAPQICEACFLWQKIKTPLEALRRAPAPAPAPTVEETQPIPPLPTKDFVYAPDGSIHFRHETKDGTPTTRKILSFPLQLVSVNRAELKLGGTTYQFRQWHPHEGVVEFELSSASLHGSGATSAMAEANVTVHDYPMFMKFLRESVDALNRTKARSMQYEQFGWKEDAGLGFLYGNRIYRNGTPETVSITDDLATRAYRYMQPQRGGSIDGWKAAADALLFGKNSEALAFATLASLAAPLIRFAERREGGAIVALITRDSGTGKTTSLTGAYTIWANDKRALGVKKRDTINSVGVNMAALCNLPIIYDEFWKSDPEALYDDVFAFTDGEDKARASRDGGIRHNAASWQTILLAASNISLLGTLQSVQRPDAPGFRIIEMGVPKSPSGLSTTEADQIREDMHRNAGHVGDAYMRYVTQEANLTEIRKMMFEGGKAIEAKGKFGREHRYWIRTLAAVGTAAAIADRLNLLSFRPQRIIQWGFDHILSMKEGGAVQNDPETFHLTLLSHFLNEHISETLRAPRAYQPGKVNDILVDTSYIRRVVARRNEDTGHYFIDRNVLRLWLQKRQVSIRDFCEDLDKRGCLLQHSCFVTLAAGTGLPGGQIAAIQIDGHHPVLTGKPRLVSVTDTERKQA